MASVKQSIGGQKRATGKQGETQGQFYRRSGIAFGQNITGMNGKSVNNMRTVNRNR